MGHLGHMGQVGHIGHMGEVGHMGQVGQACFGTYASMYDPIVLVKEHNRLQLPHPSHRRLPHMSKFFENSIKTTGLMKLCCSCYDDDGNDDVDNYGAQVEG